MTVVYSLSQTCLFSAAQALKLPDTFTIFQLVMNGVHGHSKEFRVAIVGGGICGLVAAIGLNNSGIRVDIFECAVSIIPFLIRRGALMFYDEQSP